MISHLKLKILKILILGVLFFSYSGLVFCESRDDLRKEIEFLKQRIAKLEERLEQQEEKLAEQEEAVKFIRDNAPLIKKAKAVKTAYHGTRLFGALRKAGLEKVLQEPILKQAVLG